MKRSDPRLARLPFLRRLREERALRDRHGAYLVEGVRFVASALDAGITPLTIVHAPKLLRSPLGQMIARRSRQAGVQECRVTPEQFGELSLLGEPQGIAAVLPQRLRPLPRRAGRGLWIAVEEVRSPGNLGSILRTAAGVGARGLIAIGPAVDPYAPRVIRSTMGAHSALSVHRLSHAALADWAERAGATIQGTDAAGAMDYREARLEGGVVLMIGAERSGLSAAQRAICGTLLRIPMSEAIDSLNVANATSVLLYEAYRQRHPIARRRGAQRPMRCAAAPNARKT